MNGRVAKYVPKCQVPRDGQSLVSQAWAQCFQVCTFNVVTAVINSKHIYRHVVQEYFKLYEPHLIQARAANRFQWHHFWAAGVNDIWAVDQHDKWLRFGLALHTGVEPFSGHILWMKVWHNNRNPQCILSYVLSRNS